VKLSKIVFCIGLFFVINSCNKKPLNQTDYIAWVEDEDNGLSIGKSFEDIDYQILFKPVNYILAKELVNGGIKKATIESRKKELGEMLYFTLRITSKHSNELLNANIKNENEYYQRLEYFMSYMQDDIYLVEGKDTISCSLYHYERNYGLAPYNNFVIGFNKLNAEIQDKIFIYEDKVLGTGKIIFKIKKEDIENVPEINWN
jgi:hypothetical protein